MAHKNNSWIRYWSCACHKLLAELALVQMIVEPFNLSDGCVELALETILNHNNSQVCASIS